MAFGLGMGPTTQENQSYGGIFSNAGFASNNGQKDIGLSQDFMSGLLSGDPTKVSQVLAPQIDAIQGRAQQQKQQLAMFGNRSGGNNSAATSIDSNTNRDITNLTGNLIGNAATDLGAMGTNLLGMGTSAFGNAFNAAHTMQQQTAAKWNDLISSVASVASGVMGAIPHAAGSFLDNASNIAGGMS